MGDDSRVTSHLETPEGQHAKYLRNTCEKRLRQFAFAVWFLVFLGIFSLWNLRIKIMLVEQRSIASIRPYENNPRINDAAIDHGGGLHTRVRFSPTNRCG